MSELIQLNAQTWVLQGGGNIGIVAYEDHCLIIDSGIDKDAGRDIAKQVKKLGLTPVALLVTHAHADHFGGAQYLVQQYGLKVYATRIEAAVMSSPLLEPLYLFHGAQPPRELQVKFFLAKPCLTDVVVRGDEQELEHIPVQLVSLPGHSKEQVGVAFGETFFVGDAFLTPEILDKHHIPFYTDIATGLTTLAALQAQVQPFKYIVAGHGEIYASPARVEQAITYMSQRLERLHEHVREALASGDPRSSDDILSHVARAEGASITTLSQHVLYNATVQSTLSSLYARGEIHHLLHEDRLFWVAGTAT